MGRIYRLVTALVLSTIVISCVTTNTSPFTGTNHRVANDSYIKICVINSSIDAHRFKYRGAYLGTVLAGEKRLLVITESSMHINAGNLRVHNITGSVDSRAEDLDLGSSTFWVWDFTNSVIHNLTSLRPTQDNLC